jgi:crotonobetainyl-CoA:carnitine CoA-transferase CaiB-like acyl-CoA transferase
MAPALGAHTDEVLGAIGYDAAAIASLRAGEVI